MAERSEGREDLVPRLCRAWICTDPEAASAGLGGHTFEGDVIGQFLDQPSVASRVDFLRKLTDHGQRPLPKELWSKPTTMRITYLVNNRVVSDSRSHGLESWYDKNEPIERQFAEYIRLDGFGNYSHEEVDPHLTATLVAWDDQSPDEVAMLLTKLWDAIKLSDNELSNDLHRNHVFERCQAVFSASPGALRSVFVDWVKKSLVNQGVSKFEGGQFYTIRLKSHVLFLECLLAAEKVASSPLGGATRSCSTRSTI